MVLHTKHLECQLIYRITAILVGTHVDYTTTTIKKHLTETSNMEKLMLKQDQVDLQQLRVRLAEKSLGSILL